MIMCKQPKVPDIIKGTKQNSHLWRKPLATVCMSTYIYIYIYKETVGTPLQLPVGLRRGLSLSTGGCRVEAGDQSERRKERDCLVFRV